MASPVSTPAIGPVALIIVGGYLAWFGAHYWRSDVKWPSDPVKSVLTGRGVPKATPADFTPDTQIITAVFAGASAGATTASGGAGTPGATSSPISNAALRYVGAGYVFGGRADRIGNWDCSSFVSYVLGHDLGLPLPGGRWGDPGFPPHAHGPVANTYKMYGQPINRSQVGAGDLCVWATHVGIATSRDELVSAQTPKSGTGVSTIDGISHSIGETPVFRRVTNTKTVTV